MAGPQKIPATITTIISHLSDVRTFLLTPQRRAPKFRPGQFLHLAIDPYDPCMHWPESRVFSICSAPESRNEIRITFSKVGKFTERMMTLKEGDEVWLKFPYGDFTIEEAPNTENILIAGGTGITPFMSWVWSKQTKDCKAKIVYGAKSPEHLIYASELKQACAQNPTLQWFPFIEEGNYPNAISQRLSVERIFEVCNVDTANSNNFFISGPPQMIETFQKELLTRGIAAECVFVDAW